MFTFHFYCILGLLLVNAPFGTPLAVDVAPALLVPGGFDPISPIHPGADEAAITPKSVDTTSDLGPALLDPLFDNDIVLYVISGQTFFFWVVSFLVFNIQDVVIQTTPAVSWVTLDQSKRAITGQVPFGYPPGSIKVDLVVWYSIGWRVVNLPVSVTLEHSILNLKFHINLHQIDKLFFFTEKYNNHTILTEYDEYFKVDISLHVNYYDNKHHCIQFEQ